MSWTDELGTILEFLFVILSTVVVIYFYTAIIAEPLYLLMITIPLLVLLAYVLIARTLRTPRSYRVAIVGFPRSGKTTLIVSLFGEAFAMKLPTKVTPRGTQTIELVNKSLEMLKKGRALGPTTDQDLFAFRADIVLTRRFFPITYKVEFGDFPGKHSEDYISKRDSWLQTTEFFKWVVDSDAIVFVVDLGRYISNEASRREYIAEITSAFRAAWQSFLDINEYRARQVRRHPVVLVFNKADLAQRASTIVDVRSLEIVSPDLMKSVEKEIRRLGFGDEVPPEIKIDKDILNYYKRMIETDFGELIRYFKDEAFKTRVIYVSSFGVLENQRLGMSDLLMSVFP